MNTVIGLSFVLINTLIGFFNKEKALLMYVILSIVAPITHFFGLKISYDILGFFPILFLYFLSNKKTKISISSKCLTVYLFIFMISTLVANLIYEPINELLVLFGVFRMVILFILLYNHSNYGELFKKALKIAVYINALAMILQLTLPNAVEIFNALYVKDSSTALTWFFTTGRFTRLSGTFSNIAPAGFFFLIVIAVYLVEYSKDRSNTSARIIIISIICGIATVSRTFYVGLPIILLVNFILNHIQKGKKPRKDIDLKKPVLCLVVVISIFAFNNIVENHLYISHYISNLSVSNIFSSRYSGDSGNLIDTLEVFKNNWLLGVGATRVSDEFIGDSLYVSTLHGTGITGLFCLLLLFLNLIKRNLKLMNKQNLLLILCVLMVGFAIPTIFTSFGIFVITYIDVNAGKRTILKNT